MGRDLQPGWLQVLHCLLLLFLKDGGGGFPPFIGYPNKRKRGPSPLLFRDREGGLTSSLSEVSPVLVLLFLKEGGGGSPLFIGKSSDRMVYIRLIMRACLSSIMHMFMYGSKHGTFGPALYHKYVTA